MLVEAVLLKSVDVDKGAVVAPGDRAVVGGEVRVDVPHVTAQLLDRIGAAVAH